MQPVQASQVSQATEALHWHGGQIEAAARTYPDAPLPWLDLSTGISPWPYRVGRIDREAWHRLPSIEGLKALEEAASAFFGLHNPEQIAAVPGSDIAIRLLARLLETDRVSIVSPSYGAYAATWPQARHVSFAAARNADLLVCANPNNPDGAIIPAQALQRIHNMRIVDEAFADAMPTESLIPHRNGAVVLRSFGKFFGLAGVRLGFVIADRPLIRSLKTMLGDWPISGAAIAIGTSAYRDTLWQERQKRRLLRASNRLGRMLTTYGLETVGKTANFHLCRHEAAASLFAHLCRHGILVRPFSAEPSWLRFGLPGSTPDWHRLETALNSWRHHA
nr:threonine-phosphate decarboxylase CobD [Aquisediminimonas sediminicola]